jgi:WD40 repeat protein
VFSSNGKYLVTVSNQDGSMFVWEGADTITRNRNSKSISKILFDGKGDLITVGRGYIKLWPFQQGNIAKKL